MTETKETSLSLQETAKESIRERLEFLLRGRSKSNVARAWGLPFSTLSNYFEKGAMPSLLVAMQIAKAEGVSIDWLVYGSNVTKELQQAQQAQQAQQ
ncbi:MAG: XRE family transcriptional regulator, partial [Candidatus Symbiopectobacterium sp. Dall1.0]|nr:XRE family transcriptional regulator [Candidatus Symbiopectobacterium sp. Dall1.0]